MTGGVIGGVDVTAETTGSVGGAGTGTVGSAQLAGSVLTQEGRVQAAAETSKIDFIAFQDDKDNCEPNAADTSMSWASMMICGREPIGKFPVVRLRSTIEL